MKKHWVNFVATIHCSVLVEGDEGPSLAGAYVKRHINFTGDVEGVDVEINEGEVEIQDCYEDPPTPQPTATGEADE